MAEITPREILEKYPEMRVKGYNKMMIMNGDLICINESGRSILVTEASVMNCNKKGDRSKTWNELEIKKYNLVDKGISEEGQ